MIQAMKGLKTVFARTFRRMSIVRWVVQGVCVFETEDGKVLLVVIVFEVGMLRCCLRCLCGVGLYRWCL